MRMGEENRIYSPYLVFESLVAEVGPGIDQDYPSVIECDAGRSSIPMVARVSGGADSASTPWEGNSSRCA